VSICCVSVCVCPSVIVSPLIIVGFKTHGITFLSVCLSVYPSLLLVRRLMRSPCCAPS
jgi:hypothetical protein